MASAAPPQPTARSRMVSSNTAFFWITSGSLSARASRLEAYVFNLESYQPG